MKNILKIVVVMVLYAVCIFQVNAAAHQPRMTSSRSEISPDYKEYVLSMPHDAFVSHLNEMLRISSLTYSRLLSDEDICARFNDYVTRLKRPIAVICSRDGRLDPFVRELTENEMPVQDFVLRIPQSWMRDFDQDALRVLSVIGQALLSHLERASSIEKRIYEPFEYQIQQLRVEGCFDLDLPRALKSGYLARYVVRDFIPFMICLFIVNEFVAVPASQYPYNEFFFYYVRNLCMVSPFILIIAGF